MDPNSYKCRGALRGQRSFRRAIVRAPRKLRRSARYLIIMWLCVTSSLANCVVVADEPTFFGVPYCSRCEERCGVCPSVAAAHCVPIHAVPMANIELVANPTAAERWNLTIHEAVQIAIL